MARPSSSSAGPSNHRKPFAGPSNASRASKIKANAEAGFAKRQSAKDKRHRDNGIEDVYEYVEEKTRRSKVKLDLDRDEAMEFGDIDAMDDGQREALRARLIGENEDDERVDSEDDEEVDSDAAFEESDEERFAEFFSKKKKPVVKKDRAVRFADVDLNEDSDDAPAQAQEDESEEEEDSEAEGEDDEFIDLLDVLDGKGEIDMPSDNESTKEKPEVRKPSTSSFASKGEDEEMNDISGSDRSEEDDEEEEEVIQIDASDDDEADNEALENLQSFVSGLDTAAKKRKAAEDETEGEPQKARKRRIIREKNEVGAEDEFRIDSSNSKLNLDDLLAPLATQSSSLQTLKKSTKILNSSKTKALAAPLPQRAQERLDREAAYEQTKEEVDKWNGAMKRIREAEHLSFPLQAEKPGRVSNNELTAKFKPATNLESAVDALLKNAKMRDEDIHSTEDGMLKANNLSMEEVAARRAELRKMRELMFRAEIKARRIKKIKSKTYRKIQRKAKEKLAEKIDGEEHSDDEDAIMKRELERARERATLRHKHTGKWAKQMKHGHMNEDQRKEMEEMLNKGEQLRRKIQGVGSGSEDEEEISEEDEMGEEEAMEKIRKEAFEELRALKESEGDAPEAMGKKGKSVFEMKFMKDAMARHQLEANREADDFIKELSHRERGDESEEGDDNEEQDPSSGVVVHRSNGRVVYRPGAPAPLNASFRVPHVVPPPSDTSSVTLRSTDLYSPPPASPTINKSTHPLQDDSNPWLIPQSFSSAKPSRKNEVVISKEAKFEAKSKNKLKKDANKREEEREKAREDAELDILTDNVLTLGDSTQDDAQPKSSPKAQIKKAVPTTKSAAVSDSDSDSDANSEVDAQESALAAKSKAKGKAASNAFQQRDLVALAFAGDNVVKEFEEAKAREIAEDAPKEVDTTIPGWGTWGGIGLRKKPPKPQQIKKIAGIDPTTRADYNKKHIIISEKKDKKASKYLVKDLPYPYTSQAQFEKAMERPLGVQWNTRTAFQKATLPRVVKKPGVVITPLDKLT